MFTKYDVGLVAGISYALLWYYFYEKIPTWIIFVGGVLLLHLARQISKQLDD